MWLLNTTTLKLELYVDERSCPYYVILSHTWGEDEVSFQEINGWLQPLTSEIQDRKGVTKIIQCCEQAKSDGFEYVWIDTCCIDKTNSVELSEAINSMYKWYRNAVECYVFLADVHENKGGVEFEKSRWFTRGWTLQELVAPPTILFFNSEWKEIGTKLSLCQSIHSITSIPSKVLLEQTLAGCSIAQKMSWASARKTTRTEDIAYCLLGIFGISMPLIYGEGEKSFERLQSEIIKTANDQSIFAWKSFTDDYRRGPFAKSPLEFMSCGNITKLPEHMYSTLFRSQFSLPYFMTNVGLEIHLPVIKKGISEEKAYSPGKAAILNCARLTDGKYTIIGIMIMQKVEAETWDRIFPNQLFEKSYEIALSTWSSDIDQSFTEKLLISGPSHNPSHEKNLFLHDIYDIRHISMRYSEVDLIEERFQKHKSKAKFKARVMFFNIPALSRRFFFIIGNISLLHPCFWIHALVEDNISVSQAFEMVKSLELTYEDAFKQDRVVKQLDDHSLKHWYIKVVFRKILHNGVPGYMAGVSLYSNED